MKSKSAVVAKAKKEAKRTQAGGYAKTNKPKAIRR